ncbi:MAG: cobalamin-binding protein [bacterium]|nr:cobalamin-binding protein [bacterium]
MRYLIGLALILSVIICGCGQEVVEKQSPAKSTSLNRIVSLSATSTEILFALGLGRRVVGVTTYCDYPAEAKTKEKIGGYTTPNLEKIVALGPDLVIASQRTPQQVVDGLKRAKVKTIVTWEAKTAGEVLETIKTIGRITGTKKEAEVLATDLKERMSRITARISGTETRPKVFWEVSSSGELVTVGPTTFAHNLICLAGGRNIAAQSRTAYPRYSSEHILVSNPEVIIVVSMGSAQADIEQVKNRVGWQEISAIKNNRIYCIEQNLVSRPGPRIVDGLEEVARAIHPELFKE